MTDYRTKLVDLTKTFGRRLIFNELNVEFESGSVYGISGPNGSGKSTLVKIISGLISPTNGRVIHNVGGEEIGEEKLHNYLGFISPYLVLYDEFTAWENLEHISSVRGLAFNRERIEMLLEKLNIYNRRNDLLKTYSSGMKQRVKFIFALQHSPRLLILDEPTSNLDDEGKDKFYEIIREEAQSNLVLIASNEKSDLNLCSTIVNLNDYKDQQDKQ